MSSEVPKRPACPLDKHDCEHLDEVTALRNRESELVDLVHTDTLTGLFNYRHFSHALEQEMERTRRGGQPLALLMLDIDHFKRVNDTLGHEVGNQALIHLAKIMQQMLRKVDIACRYGGEEFAVILPGTPLPRAISAAQRLRMAIQDTPLALEEEGKELSLRASIGIGIYQRDSALSPEALIKEADSYLYQAKERGRNRVSHPDLDEFRPKGYVGADEKAALFGPENQDE